MIERGEGTDLIASDGRRYIDGISSLWCNVHGHRHPGIDKAIRHELDRIAHSTMLGLSHPLAAELAERSSASRRQDSIACSTRLRIDRNGDRAKMAFQYWAQQDEPERRSFVACATRTTATRSGPCHSTRSTFSTSATDRSSSTRTT